MLETPFSCGCVDPLTMAECTRSVDHLLAGEGPHRQAGLVVAHEWGVDYDADVEARRAHLRRIGRPRAAECFPEFVELYDGE